MSFSSPRSTAALLIGAALGVLASAAHGQDAPFKRDDRGPIDLRKQKTLYVVPYAHLDTQWRWSYPQVMREFLADTLYKNFDLIEKYPNYVFNFSGSRRYEMMREYYPQDWDRLKAYIKAGRWFPCGSSVDEGDANVPSTEAMVRHVLYGNHYFRREFGVASDEFMLPDCFGFPASLPTILVHCGIKGFSTQKLTWGSAVGIPFKVGNWIGPDGAMLPAALDPGSYGGGVKEDMSQNKTWLTRIERTGAQSGIFADYHYYGTGDRGGSPDEESVKWMEKSIAGKGPLRVVSANAEQMFLDLPAAETAKLPQFKGDLLLVEHSSGSISSQAYMKRWNRKTELLADAAERSAVAAAWLGGAAYPVKKIYDAWDLALGTQMHDMLPGTSIPKAYEYCWNDFLLAANQFEAVEKDSVRAVISALDTQTRAGGVPLVVYNPLSTVREDVVEASLPGTDAAAGIQVFGPDGKETPAQVTHFADGKLSFIFLANVAPVSFTSYEAVVVPASKATAAGTALKATNRSLENARYRVTLNDGGDVSSIMDKAAKRELLAAPMRLEFHQENPEQFPAWNMDWADRQKPARGYVDGPAAIRVVEEGPVRVTLEVARQADGSRFVSRISLGAGAAGEAVEFHDKIDWGTREACLKAALSLTVSNPLAAYDDKVGAVMRGNNEPKKYEVPQHEWLDLSDKGGAYGVSVLNDSKFGSDKPNDHTVRLTLLYTPGVRGEYQDEASQDFGRHDIAYAVAGHPGSWQEGGTVTRARRFNQPLRAFVSAAHPGALDRAFSLASLDNPQVEIIAIKKAEDSDETIVRVRETSGKGAQRARIKFAAPVLAARAVDGQERPIQGAASVDLAGGQLSVQVPNSGLATYAVKLAPSRTRVEAVAATPVTLPFDADVVSTRANRADGDFDGEGRSYPAELLAPTIVSEGVSFKMGALADGQKNALTCRGQTVELPAGEYNQIVLLAAAANGDKTVEFKVQGAETKSTMLAVQDWSGYIGQWDNRIWKGTVPELTYSWSNALDGLVPGFVKPATVAWYASHRNLRGGDDFYQYCYLFKYTLDLPKGAKSLVLPNDPLVHVFAVSVTKSGSPAAEPAVPLFDTLADHVADSSATFQPAAGTFRDSMSVTVVPPLYWHGKGLHYTLDGSEPTMSSPSCNGQIVLHASATVKVRSFLPGETAGSAVSSARYEVNDTTAPTVVSAAAISIFPSAEATFSEAVEKTSAETAGNYRFEPADVTIQSVKANADGKGVTLALNAPLPANSTHRLVVNGVRDLSPAGNAVARGAATVVLSQPAFYLKDNVVCDGQSGRDIPVDGLPLGAKDPWTLNFFTRMDKQPANRTLLAGFGVVADEEGKARYMTKFANGMHFWSSGQDADTNAQFDLGRWQMVSVTFDGRKVSIYKNGKEVGDDNLHLKADEESVIHIAPLDPWDHQERFKGEIQGLSIWKASLSAEALAGLMASMPH